MQQQNGENEEKEKKQDEKVNDGKENGGGKEQKQNSVIKDGDGKMENQVNNYGLFGALGKTGYLKIVPVTLHANKKSLDTYALLDDGSQATLLRHDIAETLGLVGVPTSYNLNTIKDDPEKMNSTAVQGLEVSSRNGKNKLMIDLTFIQPLGKFHMPSRPCLQEAEIKKF